MFREITNYYIAKERFRIHCRNLVITMLCCGVAAARLLQPYGNCGWWCYFYVGTVVGVPSGLVVYLFYCFLRFAFRR